MLATAGAFCNWKAIGGWMSMFYAFGAASVLMAIMWMFVVYDSPAEHPRITEKEKKYILDQFDGQPPRMVRSCHSCTCYSLTSTGCQALLW